MDKERLMNFIKKLIPDDMQMGSISVTFNEDGSVCIFIGNKDFEAE